MKVTKFPQKHVFSKTFEGVANAFIELLDKIYLCCLFKTSPLSLTLISI